eukprot:Selendium_serpulae@DN5704_c0_g1_i2.p3
MAFVTVDLNGDENKGAATQTLEKSERIFSRLVPWSNLKPTTLMYADAGFLIKPNIGGICVGLDLGRFGLETFQEYAKECAESEPVPLSHKAVSEHRQPVAERPTAR